jgi:hypothetical protein
MATQSKMKITIIDALTQEIVEREMNEAELEQHKLDKADSLKLLAEAEAKETAKQAILDRIGLSADELQTILG